MDILYEIINTLRKNKLRTALTGFAVAWGIFILIVLLGAGNGLKNGVQSNFKNNAQNIIRLWPSYTSLEYKGFKEDRQITFEIEDLDLLKQEFPENIKSAMPVIYLGQQTLSATSYYSSNEVSGVHPDVAQVEAYRFLKNRGRFINHHDVSERRKVIVIDDKTSEVLFQTAQSVGRYIKLNSILFQVIGVYDSHHARRSDQSILIPYTTAGIIFHSGTKVDQINLLVENLHTLEENQEFAQKLQIFLAKIKQFDANDQRAIWVWNQFENYLQTNTIFALLTTAIWVIGLLTLISGIVGVGNIMLISVKERTREFGIRKAIGASPMSILKVVVLESVLLTTVFGYLGMFLGIGVTELVSHLMKNQVADESSMQIFLNPTVDLGIALGATLTLIIAGTLAGFFPARKAVLIKPVEALSAK